MTCPDDPQRAKAWHCAIKDDVLNGHPETDHGKALLASARPFPAAKAYFGECGGCGSTLLFSLRD
mgnify:CR=1 FL=1